MPADAAVSLQINVAPTDHPHAKSTLPHQIRQWGGQVQEVIFSFDLHRTSRGGRFAEGWEERLAPMQELLHDLCREHPGARIVEVDYSPRAVAEVAGSFTNGSQLPAKDTKGAPFYPYLHGIHAARADLVLHLDSDMLFGGGSQSWIAEARALLQSSPDVLACSPLPGPPRTDAALRTQRAQRLPDRSHAFRFPTISTRLCLIDRARLRERVAPIELRGPASVISAAKAQLHGNPPFQALELVLSEAMRGAGMWRVDFLGVEPGMWSLHPPFRSPEFYRRLPELIARIEAGEIPEAQRGDYELNDSMLDWSAARRRAKIRRLWA